MLRSISAPSVKATIYRNGSIAERSDEIGLLSCEFDRMMESWKYRTKVLIETNRLYEKEISTRMRTEEALKEKEAYLRTILETIQTGILITDPPNTPHQGCQSGSCGTDRRAGRKADWPQQLRVPALRR